MFNISKYVVRAAPGRTTVQMSGVALPLSAQLQRGEISIWALVPAGSKIKDRTIYVFGTGDAIKPEVVEKVQYIGTVQEGPLVWHVFID